LTDVATNFVLGFVFAKVYEFDKKLLGQHFSKIDDVVVVK
jgi:hypothetical protein